ncbi:hypothetical protein VE01_05660 [Pseudogymnoascus verrucosus]|uniref:N-acetyltransferase domain-containing protein n=1 Tax=Pseudogymnoascus verrucosus TaxID=342668 RepID=A0A1B8GKM5_9PEZI|nr:uncharacterized protein VE01_05660 [Pseudogymnoascus verrucosus]OBT96397.1 hypothetical protein VE01_05660 [Pseudogymnoascus verrucosus]
MASSFRSERLMYCGLEDTPRDKAFIHSILSDRTSSENATNYLVKPASSADVDSFMRGFREAFLGVLVCIPNPSAPQTPSIIGYVNLQHTTHPHHRSCTMSIRIVPAAQGRGYGSEAIKWVLEWGFLVAGLHRVSIGCFSFNEGARRLYERLGFVVEGRTREVAWKNGGWHDCIEMGMLEGEWREKYFKVEG